MLLESVKTFERLKGKVEQQEIKYDECFRELSKSVQALQKKINDLKGIAETKRSVLKERISVLEENIAEKLHTISTDDNAQAGLKELSIELDLCKNQDIVLSNMQRKTLMVNCKKEIAKVKEQYQEVILQFKVLYLIYCKFFHSLNSLTSELNSISKEKTNSFDHVHSAVAAATIKYSHDVLKPVVDYVFDVDTKAPYDTDSDRPTAHDVLVDDYLQRSPLAKEEAEKIVERM